MGTQTIDLDNPILAHEFINNRVRCNNANCNGQLTVKSNGILRMIQLYFNL